MKYRIKPCDDSAVDVYLEDNDDEGITLMVGEWAVVTLRPNGRLYLEQSIPEHNTEGLQVDSDGEIELAV